MLASQFLWKLIGQLVKEEFASGEFEILLVHTVAAFEASHDHGRRALEESEVGIELGRQLSTHLCPTVVTEGGKLVRLGTLVEQDLVRGSHASNHWTFLGALNAWNKLLTSFWQRLKHLRRWHSNMLGFIILSSAFSLILGLLSGGFLITILQVRVDVLGDAVNLVLDLRQTLNLVRIHFG